MPWMNTVVPPSSLFRVAGRAGLAVLVAVLLFLWTARRSSSLEVSGSSVSQDMLPLQFAQEYIRELAEQESLRAQADFQKYPPDANPFGPIVEYTAAMRFALSADVHLLNNAHLVLDAAFGHRLDSVPSLLAQLYKQKMRILGSMSDIAGASTAGPRHGMDNAGVTAEISQLRAALESADKGLWQTSYLVFAALIDPSSDRHGNFGQLSITCEERGILRSELQADFGASLKAKTKTNLVAAAALLDNLLSGPIECAGHMRG